MRIEVEGGRTIDIYRQAYGHAKARQNHTTHVQKEGHDKYFNLRAPLDGFRQRLDARQIQRKFSRSESRSEESRSTWCTWSRASHFPLEM